MQPPYLSLLLLLLSGLSISSPVAKDSKQFPISSQLSPLSRVRTRMPTSSRWLCNQRVGQVAIYDFLADNAYATNVTIGTQDFLLLIDTGSSDTWVVETGFTCYNGSINNTVPEADCQFASTFTVDSTFYEIPDENFHLKYGGGSFVTGVFGYETVSIAGLQLSQQEVAAVSAAFFSGDNVTSGITGFDFPTGTSEYFGTNVSADNRTDPTSHRPYSPIINSIFFVENLTAPLFSLSLSRNPSVFGVGGYLSIGGIPDPSMPTVNASGSFVTVPLEKSLYGYKTPQYNFYTISIDGLVYDSYAPGSGKSAGQYIIDSGTTLNYFHRDDAILFNSLYDPPAQNSSEYGAFIVQCNATAPPLGITIGGETFYVNPADLIFNADPPNQDLCYSGVQDGGSLLTESIFILGDVFQKNVLSVFDVGNLQMSFSPRMYYASQ